jgi:hypothetical protein
VAGGRGPTGGRPAGTAAGGGQLAPDGPCEALLSTIIQIATTATTSATASAIAGRELRRW